MLRVCGRGSALLLALGLSMAVVGGACADDAATAQARRQVQAAYDRMSAAASRRDVDGWLSGKTSDFVSVGLDGKEVGLASRRALLTFLMASVQQLTTDTRILRFERRGAEKARARIREHTVMRLKRPDKRCAKVVIDTLAESDWVLTAAGWREARCRSLRESATLDGKPMRAPSP